MAHLKDRIRDALPGPVHRAQLAMRRAPLMRRAGIIFIHIPKNAGVSVNRALYGRFMGHYTAREVARYCPLLFRQLPSFAVARNPWARCLSAYRFAVQPPGPEHPDMARIARPEQYRTPEFASFDRFVREWLPDRPLAMRDQVFHPQWRYVCDADGRIIVDHIGRIERMGDVARWIEQTVGRPVEIGHSNRSSDRREVEYRSAYTDETARIVAELYARDIEMFGYRF